jgi:hypothetical protein
MFMHFHAFLPAKSNTASAIVLTGLVDIIMLNGKSLMLQTIIFIDVRGGAALSTYGSPVALPRRLLINTSAECTDL